MAPARRDRPRLPQPVGRGRAGAGRDAHALARRADLRLDLRPRADARAAIATWPIRTTLHATSAGDFAQPSAVPARLSAGLLAARSARLRSDRLVEQRLRQEYLPPARRGPYLLLPQPDALRLERRRLRAARAAGRADEAGARRRSCAACAAGTRRGTRAGRSPDRQLGGGGGADRAVLRARVGDDPPAGADGYPRRDRRAGRLLPDRDASGAVQAS